MEIKSVTKLALSWASGIVLAMNSQTARSEKALGQAVQETTPAKAEVVVQPQIEKKSATLSVAVHGEFAMLDYRCKEGNPQACFKLALESKEHNIVAAAVNEMKSQCENGTDKKSVHSCENVASFYEVTPLSEFRNHDQAYQYFVTACGKATALDRVESRSRKWIVCVTARQLAAERNGVKLQKQTRVTLANHPLKIKRKSAQAKRNSAQAKRSSANSKRIIASIKQR